MLVAGCEFRVELLNAQPATIAFAYPGGRNSLAFKITDAIILPVIHFSAALFLTFSRAFPAIDA